MSDLSTNVIHTGDCVETLEELPESSVHMVMTSPPYFGLRDYGVDGQIGLEDELASYIDKLVRVFREVRRVLRPDGSAWLNLGDSYAGSGPNNHHNSDGVAGAPENKGPRNDTSRLKRKNKMLVPHRVAIALQDDGWVVRNDVTWVKPNPMPSSVKDRLNTTTEQIFHLVPKPDYWYDLDAVREPYNETTKDRYQYEPPKGEAHDDYADATPISGGDGTVSLHEGGKNPGDVFEVTTKPFPEAHFAVYPPELCEKPIKATCPPTVCADCGAPYERSTEERQPWERDADAVERDQLRRALELADEHGLGDEHFKAIQSVGFQDAGQAVEVYDGAGRNDDRVERLAAEAKDALGGYFREFITNDTESVGWEQTCNCDTDATDPGIALDPFAGAGTTCKVAKRLRRRFIGIELNPEYADMARVRCGLSPDDPAAMREDDQQSGVEEWV